MIKFLTSVLRPFRFLIVGQILVGIIWAIDLSLRPYILKMIIDSISCLQTENAIQQLLIPIGIYLGMSLLIVVLFRIYDFIWLHLNPGLKRYVGDVLMKMMLHHSVVLFQNQFAGNLAAKIKDVMSGVPDLLRVLINHLFSHFVALVIAIFAVWSINYKFSLLLLAWAGIYGIGSFFFSRRVKILSIQSAESRSRVVGQIVDIFTNISSVYMFSAKQYESKALMVYLDDLVAANQRRDWLLLWMFAFQGLSFVIYQTIGFAFLLYDFKNGLVTPGDFALLVTININIISALWSLSEDIVKCSEIIGDIRQGLQIALSPIEIKDNPHAKILRVSQGAITFDKVTFHYKGTKLLFQDKSVEIPAGQKVGLVGYSGGGKSTFVNLILRLYDVTGGRILIDGQDIREVTQDSLRNNIGMIPQDPSLFHRSLIENIRYGKPDASESEVIEAAKKAHAHDFITRLAQGYHTLVGERGIKLSGGQRQRIAIARAILKNAPILILDEATSQLDSVTENLIQESIWELMQGKTSIVIAHRLSTLLHMDRILVFDKGSIVEDGTHHELIAKHGLYKQLWSAQIGGFLVDER